MRSTIITWLTSLALLLHSTDGRVDSAHRFFAAGRQFDPCAPLVRLVFFVSFVLAGSHQPAQPPATLTHSHATALHCTATPTTRAAIQLATSAARRRSLRPVESPALQHDQQTVRCQTSAHADHCSAGRSLTTRPDHASATSHCTALRSAGWRMPTPLSPPLIADWSQRAVEAEGARLWRLQWLSRPWQQREKASDCRPAERGESSGRSRSGSLLVPVTERRWMDTRLDW